MPEGLVEIADLAYERRLEAAAKQDEQRKLDEAVVHATARRRLEEQKAALEKTLDEQRAKLAEQRVVLEEKVKEASADRDFYRTQARTADERTAKLKDQKEALEKKLAEMSASRDFYESQAKIADEMAARLEKERALSLVVVDQSYSDEQDALELFNEMWVSQGSGYTKTWSVLTDKQRKLWLSILRKAREQLARKRARR